MGAVVEVGQVEHVPGLVGEDEPVRRVLLEDGDDPPDVGAVGAQRGVHVDDLGGVGVHAGGVRVGDEVHDVVAGEVDLPVGRGEGVAQVGAAALRTPVPLYGVRGGRLRHADPALQGVGAQGELAVGGLLEVAAGGREVVGGEFGRGDHRCPVRERQEDHDRVEGAGGTRVGGVPGVQALGVVGVRAFQGAGVAEKGSAAGALMRQVAASAVRVVNMAAVLRSRGRGSCRGTGDLRERFAGHRHPACGNLSYYALFVCPRRVRTRKRGIIADTPGILTERHKRSPARRTGPAGGRNDLSETPVVPGHWAVAAHVRGQPL